MSKPKKQTGSQLQIGNEQQPKPRGLTESEKMQLATGKQKRLDPSYYQALPQYQDMQLFYELDIDGRLNKWFDLGAVPVRAEVKSRHTFPGLNDQVSNEWEFTQVDVTDTGDPIRCYLLAMTKEDYYKYRILPKENRQKEINATMRSGRASDDSITRPDVKGLQTYAPEVGGGERGLQTHNV